MNKALRNRILIIVGIIIVSILLFFGIFFLLNIFFGYKPSSNDVTNLENDKANTLYEPEKQREKVIEKPVEQEKKEEKVVEEPKKKEVTQEPAKVQSKEPEVKDTKPAIKQEVPKEVPKELPKTSTVPSR